MPAIVSFCCFSPFIAPTPSGLFYARALNVCGGFPKVDWSNPLAVYGAIFLSFGLAWFNNHASTADRFTGREGRALKAQIRDLEQELADILEHGPKQVQIAHARMATTLEAFVVGEKAVRQQHNELEGLTRQILREVHDHCRQEHKAHK